MTMGGKLICIERCGPFELYVYGSSRFPGYAVFKAGQCVINGKFEPVITKYRELLLTQ